ncbi:Nfrkb-like protein [Dorcoceras hygrometricum]|uniref:Nfrkb-like protein n=1 Tax=Dorcoceras hygrometricum TaxID=472368 RepID=A0A2Z7BLB2_9LAMI|nr:Nfrkb-like protein [Dorcoceras hygrometricum]
MSSTDPLAETSGTHEELSFTAATALLELANSYMSPEIEEASNTIISMSQKQANFHEEEARRYANPTQPFVYTASDGTKSTVAPIRKVSGSNNLIQVRDHHLFKDSRPPQFSMLNLVRDAVARLAGGAGTRDDVCALVRGSQYLVDDIDEEALTKVVRGALDRLRSESDACVRYDKDSRVWVYLHRGRGVEDF